MSLICVLENFNYLCGRNYYLLVEGKIVIAFILQE